VRACVIVLLFVFVVSVAITSPARGGGWPTYGHDFSNTRHVDEGQITTATVHRLTLAWKYRLSEYGVIESTPIVVGRTMYVTTGHTNAVVALDAATGALLWRYQPPLRGKPAVNRGVAVDGGQVFYLTLDDVLIALDARTGAKRWSVQVADPIAGYRQTMAPLAWHGLVYIGVAGDEVAIRGFIAAFSQRDGHEVWRWWAVSPGWEGRYVEQVNGLWLHRDIAREKRNAWRYRDAWRHGGGAVWMTPALDPSRATLYAGTGNPSFRGADVEPGDNLYTDSVVALGALDGKLRWYYQEVPHDRWDYDAGSPPALFAVTDSVKRPVQAVAEAGKDGWLYILRRSDGALIRLSQPFVPQRGIFAELGPSATFAEPSGLGGTVAPIAFDPALQLAFVSASMGHDFKHANELEWTSVGRSSIVLTAIDVQSGKIAWRRVTSTGDYLPNRMDGPLSADDLVFMGQETGGALRAYDAKTGTVEWTFQTDPGGESEPDAPHRPFGVWVHDMLSALKHWLLREPAAPPQSYIQTSPIAYTVDGREYVAVIADAYNRYGTSPGDTVYAFALPR
jgi:alcohol dehydrogenase (cytochrome c)